MFRVGGKELFTFKHPAACFEAPIHKTCTKPLRCDARRNLFITCQRHGKPQTTGNEDFGKPIKFSTSKASHRTWNVERSFGSHYQKPWWKVAPVSLIGLCFLLWCIFRKETELDRILEKDLYEQMPGLVSDEDKDEETNKPNS